MKTPNNFLLRKWVEENFTPVKGAKPAGSSDSLSPVKAAQRSELRATIARLQSKVNALDAVIHQREAADLPALRKVAAKRNAAFKSKTKPAAVTKGALLHEFNGLVSATAESKVSTSELRSLSTRVHGEIAVAQRKLSAL